MFDSCQLERTVDQNAAWIDREWGKVPQAAIILGTGLGDLTTHIDSDLIVDYDQLVDFPLSTALGHRGRIVCGRLGGVEVIAMDGRFHFYEGHGAEQATLSVRIAAKLGAGTLIVTNASGGLNPQFRSGDIMAIADHMNLMGKRTAGIAETHCGPSRSLSRCLYDPELLDLVQATARRRGFVCHRGVYISVLGPNYETRAEYRMMRRLGGDAVGMSTVPEVLVAAQCAMRILALSTITNVARPDAPARVDPHEVVDIASTAEPRLRAIVQDVLDSLAADDKSSATPASNSLGLHQTAENAGEPAIRSGMRNRLEQRAGDPDAYEFNYEFETP